MKELKFKDGTAVALGLKYFIQPSHAWNLCEMPWTVFIDCSNCEYGIGHKPPSEIIKCETKERAILLANEHNKNRLNEWL